MRKTLQKKNSTDAQRKKKDLLVKTDYQYRTNRVTDTVKLYKDNCERSASP